MKTTTFNWSLSTKISDVKVLRKKKELTMKYRGVPITVLERDVPTRGGIIDNWACKIQRELDKGNHVVMVFTRQSNKELVESFKKRYPLLEKHIAVGTVLAMKRFNNIYNSGTQPQQSV